MGKTMKISVDKSEIALVRFVLFSDSDLRVYESALRDLVSS